MATPVRLPPIATDTTEGTVIRWLVAAGEAVEEGQVLVELDTAKVVFEVEAPGAGTVLALLADEGQDVQVGDVLAWLGAPDEAVPEAPPASVPAAGWTRGGPATDDWPTASDAPARPARPAADGPVAAPPVRRLAERLGVDLAAVAGTGEGGRVLLDDVRRAAGEDV